MKRIAGRIFCVILSWLLVMTSLPCVATTTTNELYYGDVDNSGELTTSDARKVLLSLAQGSEFADAEQADYNMDRHVDTTDVRQMLMSIVYQESLLVYVPTDWSAAAYSGEPYRILYNNTPRFRDLEKQSTTSFEQYASLDSLGRCGVAYANLSTELMPTEERGSVSSVTPSGWNNQLYDCVSGGWLYNRTHLIGFQLAGEQANAANLITGTRYLNAEGMLPFENMVADYIKETNNHVLYRVTPIFTGTDLLAQGVLMEAWSVEDNGEGIRFCVYCYNVQSGVVLDYATGENYAVDDGTSDGGSSEDTDVTVTFVLNTSSKKFHLPTCRHAATIKAENRQDYSGDRESLIADGYQPCGTCKP